MLRYFMAAWTLGMAATVAAQEPPQTFFVDAAHTGPQDGSSRNPFRTITAALNATTADRGDRVTVRPGTYPEVLLVGAGETLIGIEGAYHTFITGNPNTPADLVTLGQGAQIRGFSIGETGGSAIKVPLNGSATISNCVLYESDLGLFVEVDAAAGVFNNTFFDNGTGVRGGLDAAIAPLKNNAFSDNGTGVSVASSAMLDSGFNAFFNNGVAVEGAFPADTDFVSNPLFVAPAARNFHLRAASNLRDAGDPAAEYNDRDGSPNDAGADGGPDGARDTLAPQIFVSADPASMQGPAPLAILFNANASLDEWGIASFEWDFDALDGITAEGFGGIVPVLYDTPGEYLVTLRLTDNSGLESTTSFNVIVGDPPVIAVTADPAIGPAPLSVQFNSGFTGTPGGLLFDWDFDGDGIFDSADENPRFTYTDLLPPGLYPVLLNVQDADQVSAQQRVFITLTAFDPEATAAFGAGQPGSLVVEDGESAVAGVSVNVPANAFNTPMTVGISTVSEDALPLDPPGEFLAQAHLSPVGVRFGREVRVNIPAGAAIADETAVKVWRFDPESQAWLDADIKNIRATTADPAVVSFDTPQFGTFAVTLDVDADLPVCGCAASGQSPAGLRGDVACVALLLLALAAFTRRRPIA